MLRMERALSAGGAERELQDLGWVLSRRKGEVK
jgi:predicted RNA binding protein YcfA (HicA-like mRNA interferase family)